jgi:ABC-type antimicrobial peptide transport system permease subunit
LTGGVAYSEPARTTTRRIRIPARRTGGVLAGAIATVIYASSKNWAIVIPAEAWTGGIASAILIGAFAGLMPAVRASRLPPTVALRTV